MRVSFRTAVVAAGCLLFVGCATQQKTSALECGAGGAAVGYLICKAMGKSDRDCLGAGVVVGGAAAAGCWTYAGQLEKRKKALAGRENDLDARLVYVRGLNEDATRMNAELEKQLVATTQKVDALKANRRISEATLAKERERLDAELKLSNQQVALQDDALREVKAFRNKRSGRPSADLDAEIAKQDRLLADAKEHVRKLAEQRARI